jgi:hypothetical protein
VSQVTSEKKALLAAAEASNARKDKSGGGMFGFVARKKDRH